MSANEDEAKALAAAAVKLEAQSKKAFEDAVRAILTTFGVFTGFAIKSAIDGIKFPASPSLWAVVDVLNDFHLFICIATVALLLRFIIGSAVHLNLCYVVEPRSKMPVMLFKDLAFLIAFGLLAVFMIHATDVASFAIRAGCFIAIGVVWSLVDYLARFKFRQVAAEKSLFFGWWIFFDFGQLLLTWVTLNAFTDVWRQSVCIAVLFSAALYGDMRVILLPKAPKG